MAADILVVALAIVLSVLILLLGGLGIVSLPIAQFPDIAPPTVYVSVAYPGASAKVLTDSVLIPLEQSINGVQGMRYIVSDATSAGEATIRIFFEPGTEPASVVETAVGRIGVGVCYDLNFPELARGLALAGADLLALPANFPLYPRPEGERPIEVTNAMATAHLNHMFVAVCDRAGPERGVEWVGGSVVCDEYGWLLAGPLPDFGPGLVVADCDLSRAREKAWNERNDVFADRRPHLYRLGERSPAS